MNYHSQDLFSFGLMTEGLGLPMTCKEAGSILDHYLGWFDSGMSFGAWR